MVGKRKAGTRRIPTKKGKGSSSTEKAGRGGGNLIFALKHLNYFCQEQWD